MKKKYFKGLRCFTPEVALATFIIEIVLAIYAFVRYRTSRIGKILIFFIILLSVFQASEYMVCSSGDSHLWYLVGYLAITLLPALSLYSVTLITRRTWVANVYTFFTLCFLAAFWLVPGAVSGTSCAGNYVIFRSLNSYVTPLFYAYYAIGLVLGVYEMYIGARMFKNDSQMKKYFCWLIVGSLSFMLPTAILVFIPPFTLQSIPSVLCGFAVLHALILSFIALPIVHKRKL
jgi:hypothetical protein